MKISAVNYNQCYTRKVASKNYHENKITQATTFKGETGQAAGAALGMLAGVAASFVVGPLVALAVAGVGLVGGGLAGDEIEERNNKNKKQ